VSIGPQREGTVRQKMDGTSLEVPVAGTTRTRRAPTRTPIRLTAHQARLVHLAAQGLLTPPRRRARKEDVLTAIRRMGVLQIDTIHIVARSPFLVLYSRLGAYRQEWLEELLAEGAIFECWAHAACFAPTEDYALHRQHALGLYGFWAMRSARHIQRYHGKKLRALLERVRDQGPVKAADFEAPKRGGSGGWWGWKAEKRWLEALFALGDLMITRRENFHRVYDLRERVMAKPAARAALMDPDAVIGDVEVSDHFTLKAVRVLGITQARWIADYFRASRRLKDADLDRFVDRGELVRAEVEGWSQPGYIHRDHVGLAARAAGGRLLATHTTVLSPFDPVVWDRERVAAMFGFDYRIECYVPAPKRQYGYYVLPILHGGELVGRLDAKAHRADGVFEVKSLYLERHATAGDGLAEPLAAALRACASWHATPTVAIAQTQPRGFAKMLRAALAAAVSHSAVDGGRQAPLGRV
jgi:uncharacterized protein YcaQ